MPLIGRIIAICLCFCLTPLRLAYAESPPSPDILVEVPSSATIGDENEVETHWRQFIEIGFSMIPWSYAGPERINILRNLLGPDHRARTGSDIPEDAAFDYAVMNLTGGSFNDVIVSSRVPGECQEDGCSIVVFHTDDGADWSVVARFRSLAVAHRILPNGIAELAAIGDDVTPSYILRWDGKAFVQQ